jgi:hypothetical protein
VFEPQLCKILASHVRLSSVDRVNRGRDTIDDTVCRVKFEIYGRRLTVFGARPHTQGYPSRCFWVGRCC